MQIRAALWGLAPTLTIMACSGEPPSPTSGITASPTSITTSVATATAPPSTPTIITTTEPQAPPAPTAAQVHTPAPVPTALSIATAAPTPTTAPVPIATTRATATPMPTTVPVPIATTRATATPMPTPTGASAQPATQLWITVAAIPGSLPSYDRDDWRHWIDEDRDCQDTRHEVLIAESRTSVTYKSDRRCRVDAGQWWGAFTATIVTEASKLDVDHLVPLGNAHRSGGWAWVVERKRRYANSLDDPEHLIAVTASANRSKGARGPDQWKPPNQSYWCKYATHWTRVKHTWGLTATPPEAAALQDMLDTCLNPPQLTIVQGAPAASPASPTPATTASATYASCDEAEAAGEPRVQGSKGPGRGFPKATVPSARDGDGDGVVCEIAAPASSSASPTPAPAASPASPTPATAASATYASCDEAEAAGEPRVQGSKGPGRGFPKATVPSARDGDGDGVVCEK